MKSLYVKAISVRYLPATASRPARLVATDGDGNSVVVPYDRLGDEDRDGRYRRAAAALITKMNWTGQWVAGWLGDTCVFVDRSQCEDLVGETRAEAQTPDEAESRLLRPKIPAKLRLKTPARLPQRKPKIPAKLRLKTPARPSQRKRQE